jgi:hypothetical protein
MRTRTLIVLVAVACLATLLFPAHADAQRRGPYYRSYYRPYRASFYVGFGGPFLYSPWAYFPFGYYQRYPYYFGGPVATGVRIQVEPKTAGVYVDGVYAGVVDDFDGYFQRLVVSPGGHEITIYQAGYHSIVKRLYAQPRSTTHIKGTMEPLAPGEPDDPLPQAAPQPQQQVPDRYLPPQPDRPEQPAQPPRPVEPRRPYEPVRPVEPMRPGEPAAPSPAGYGQLALRWQPADATARIDGESWQSSAGGERLTLHLAAGLHHVEIRKEGFLPFVTDVQIRPGDTTVLNVSLTERR